MADHDQISHTKQPVQGVRLTIVDPITHIEDDHASLITPFDPDMLHPYWHPQSTRKRPRASIGSSCMLVTDVKETKDVMYLRYLDPLHAQRTSSKLPSFVPRELDVPVVMLPRSMQYIRLRNKMLTR